MASSYLSLRCFALIFLLFAVAAVQAAHESPLHKPIITNLYQEPIQPLHSAENLNPQKVLLGEKLFHDQRFGQNNDMSCSSCHIINLNGADHLPHSIGHNGAKLSINTPTVFNSSINPFQFWDGRANKLEDQINFVVKNANEFATNWAVILDKLKKDNTYISTFNSLYPDGLNEINVRDAIAVFERSLVTVNSPFDQYLSGKPNAISQQAKRGYRLFKNYGCVACHQGSNVGGNLFMRIGVFGDYFADRGNITSADLGRFNVTGKKEDRFIFRVPSLRLAALTPPYFHDGSVKTLSQAIKIMAQYQLGRIIPIADIDAIEAFIETLSGEYKGKPLLIQVNKTK